ncbi:MAG: CRISPR-associated endonuclease Cas2 [Desulfopila sp.]
MDHVYLVCYDITEPKRWRKVYRTMKGYGAWLQLSVFQCRLSRENLLKMTDTLEDLIDASADHLLIIDIGPAETVNIRVDSIGKPFQPVDRKAIVV